MIHVIRENRYLIVDKTKKGDIIVPPKPSPDHIWTGEIWEIGNTPNTIISLKIEKLKEIGTAFYMSLAQGVTVSIDYNNDTLDIRMDAEANDGILVKMGYDLAVENNESKMDIIDYYNNVIENVDTEEVKKIFKAQGMMFRKLWKKHGKLRKDIEKANTVTEIQNISW